jgi:hypothetical protein
MQQLTNLLQSNEMTRRHSSLKATLDSNLHKSHSILSLKVPVDQQ